MKLIIKADDFATTIGVTDGILDAMHNGVVTDTSLLVNTPHLDYAVKQAKQYGVNEMGLHLALTYRQPISDCSSIPSLVDHNGNFYTHVEQLKENYKIEDVEYEFRKQIAVFQSTGLILTHLDTHHHIHRVLNKDVANLLIQLAKELKVPIRKPIDRDLQFMNASKVKTTDYFIDSYGGCENNSTEEKLMDILSKYSHQEGTLELMAHPGYLDEELFEISSWNKGRLEEMRTFTSPSFIQFLKENNFSLIKFKDI